MDFVAGTSSQLRMSLIASTSVARVSGCQYLSCQCLGCRVLHLSVPLPQLVVFLQLLLMLRLLLSKLPVPLPQLPVSAGALAGVQVLCHGCQGEKKSPTRLLRTVVRRLLRIPMSHQHRCPVSRPSSPQTTTDQVICNTKNVMKI